MSVGLSLSDSAIGNASLVVPVIILNSPPLSNMYPQQQSSHISLLATTTPHARYVLPPIVHVMWLLMMPRWRGKTPLMDRLFCSPARCTFRTFTSNDWALFVFERGEVRHERRPTEHKTENTPTYLFLNGMVAN